MPSDWTLFLAQVDDAPPQYSGPRTGGEAATTAEPGAPATGPVEGPARGEGGGGGGMLLFFAVAMGLMLLLMMGGSRKERKKREALIASLKKGDRVQTIGGVVGRIIEIRDSEVVVESSNTRLTFARSAIQGRLEDKEPAKA